MLQPGVYPASVTPFTEKGRIDPNGIAKLLAHFQAAGCKGVVLAGTNGEGPSLSAVEKRDLIQTAGPLRGSLNLILGVATPSLDEAVWLCKRAYEFSASAVLLMPPFYFRSASAQAITDWFLHVLERSPLPIIVYNFPKATGITLTPDMLTELGQHENCAGCKDSSGEPDNLQPFRQAFAREDQRLFVGDETLLLAALQAGWSGTISGAANVVAPHLSRIIADWEEGLRDSASERFQVLLPVLQLIRQQPQPATNKACLQRMGILERNLLRLPLEPPSEDSVHSVLEAAKKAVGLSVA